MAFTLNVANSGTASGISLAASGTPDLVVACFAKDSANDPTAVQYGGVAMTRLTETVNGAQGAEIWYLIAGIPSGTQSITYTLAGAHRCFGGAFDVAAGKVVEFDTEAGTSGTSTSPSQAVTPTAQPNVIIACCAHEGASIMTAKGTGQVGLETGGGDGFIDEGTWNSAATYEPTTSTSADTQSFTNGASDTWSLRVAVFREVDGPAVSLGDDSDSYASGVAQQIRTTWQKNSEFARSSMLGLAAWLVNDREELPAGFVTPTVIEESKASVARYSAAAFAPAVELREDEWIEPPLASVVDDDALSSMTTWTSTHVSNISVDNSDAVQLFGQPHEERPALIYAWPTPPLPRAIAVDDEPAATLFGQPLEDRPTLIFAWPVPPLPRAVEVEDEPAATLYGHRDEGGRIVLPATPIGRSTRLLFDSDEIPIAVAPTMVDDAGDAELAPPHAVFRRVALSFAATDDIATLPGPMDVLDDDGAILRATAAAAYVQSTPDVGDDLVAPPVGTFVGDGDYELRLPRVALEWRVFAVQGDDGVDIILGVSVSLPFAAIFVNEEMLAWWTDGIASIFTGDDGMSSSNDERRVRQNETPKTITVSAFTKDAFPNLTTYTNLQFRMVGPATITGAATGDATGTFSYTFTGAQLATLGTYEAVFTGTDPGGQPKTFPEETNLRVIVIPAV